MTKGEIFYNKLSKFFDSNYTLVINAILLFVGFAFNLEIYFITLAVLLTCVSLINGKSVKTLLSFALFFPISLSQKFVFNKINIITLAMGGAIIFASLVYYLVKNFKYIKTQFAWGKLIAGLTFGLVLMFFVGITQTSYLANLYYLLALCAIMTIYVLSSSTRDYQFLAKLIVAFSILVNFELVVEPSLTFNNSVLVINIIAICCLFADISDWITCVFYNLMAALLLVFSLVYASSVVAVITLLVYVVASCYYMAKNIRQIPVVIGAWIIGVVVLFICNWYSDGSIFAEFANGLNSYTFSTGLVESLNGVAVAFGFGFLGAELSVCSIIASVGVIGIFALSVLFLQIFKRMFTNLTYNKMFLILGLVALFVCSLVASIPAVMLGVIFVYLALAENENLNSARSPLTNKGWEEKVQVMKQKAETEKTFYERMLKRPLDFILSLVAIVVLSPLFLLIFIVSKISIGGKAIFSQYRPGKNGKVFKLYKFRSMNNKTDEKGNLLPDSERITKFGKVIRKLSVDELPQLFNILKGDMSIVGTRPRIVKDIVFYDNYALQAYSIRPGLTSLSQISGGRATAPFEDIIEKDVKYAKNITFWGDVYILFRTVFVLFEGSSGEVKEGERKDYFYCNYLLHSGQITKEQYEEGIRVADEIIKNKGVVTYTERLHKN